MDRMMLMTQALSAAMRGRAVDWNGCCREGDWDALYALSREHRVQPLVLEAVYRCPDFSNAAEPLKKAWKRDAMLLGADQTARGAAFGEIYAAMEASGLQPIVMKGAVCRNLYPNPDQRPSSDEDLLLPPGQFTEAFELLRDLGLQPLEPTVDPKEAFEIGMLSPRGVFLELHKTPFAPEGAAVESCNSFFADAHDRAVRLHGVLSMCPHDHMLYLLLHAYKHFVHSGFGLRQVCDIALWAEKYAAQIDWELLWSQLRQVRCLKFAQTVFAAAAEYLDYEPAELLPQDLPIEEVMEDLLGAGVYGSSTGSRIHSATVTLHAVEADRRGKRNSLLRSVFPKRDDLLGRYPYLRQYPVLLPVAWCSRLVCYARETASPKGENSPAESLSLGTKRKELLRKLDIID